MRLEACSGGHLGLPRGLRCARAARLRLDRRKVRPRGQRIHPVKLGSFGPRACQRRAAGWTIADIAASWTADLLVREFERLAARGLGREVFVRHAGERLRRSVSADGACWHTIDPATLFMTSDIRERCPRLRDRARQLRVRRCGRGQQVLRARHAPFPVGILSKATGGHPERSARYRTMLAPSGVPLELRATFISRRRAWGSICLVRQSGRKDFTTADATLLARLSRPIADGLRSSLLVDAAGRGDEPGAPELVVLDRRGEVELITPPARPMFEELRASSAREPDDAPPTVVLAVAAAARAATRQGRRGGVGVPAPARRRRLAHPPRVPPRRPRRARRGNHQALG